ncbi:hypothetical protein LTR62_006820 [Meristemomyces frigidus]|uniref:Uncharacterized protein n=1 Tax=Meristemomyces frigidus TaxID=1508187 RepID=A0AAN7TBT6_9PEZI|nr:hypothetical protein LTR62_006820 [Meristemomyces frigidus]
MLYYKEAGTSQRKETRPTGLHPTTFGANGKSKASLTYADIESQLSNEVHPLFARNRFPGTDYEKILPALRLASLLIDTECLLEFWHTMWFGDYILVGDDEVEGDWHYVNVPFRPQLSTKDVAMTRARLNTMSHMVTFYRRTNMAGALGECSHIQGFLDIQGPYETGDFIGNCSMIEYSDQFYQGLCDASNSNDQQTYSRLSFKFAALVVHELAHAAKYAAWSFLPACPKGQHATMAEDGFDWENAVFGCILDVFGAPRSRDFQFITEWPSGCTGKKHQQNEWHMWIEGACPDVDVSWELPFYYVYRLFTTNFWRSTVPAKGAAALKVLGIRGRLFKLDDDGRHDQLRGSEQEDRDNFEHLVPDEYCVDDEYEATMKPFAPNFEFEGFGRLLKIDHHSLFSDRESGSGPK